MNSSIAQSQGKSSRYIPVQSDNQNSSVVTQINEHQSDDDLMFRHLQVIGSNSALLRRQTVGTSTNQLDDSQAEHNRWLTNAMKLTVRTESTDRNTGVYELVDDEYAFNLRGKGNENTALVTPTQASSKPMFRSQNDMSGISKAMDVSRLEMDIER